MRINSFMFWNEKYILDSQSDGHFIISFFLWLEFSLSGFSLANHSQQVCRWEPKCATRSNVVETITSFYWSSEVMKFLSQWNMWGWNTMSWSWWESFLGIILSCRAVVQNIAHIATKTSLRYQFLPWKDAPNQQIKTWFEQSFVRWSV